MRKAPSTPDFPLFTKASELARTAVISVATGRSGHGESALSTGQVGPASTRPSIPESSVRVEESRLHPARTIDIAAIARAK